MAEQKEIKSFEIKSQAMLDIYREVQAYARHKQGFILFGQTGTGKELLARHFFNLLKNLHPEITKFISLNCAALSPELIISELFGHEKGAFTGAIEAKQGIFEDAENSVLFLDEIGDLHPEAQPMLLRALDPHIREGKRLGSNISYPINDTIIISATDKGPRDLKESLLYRLGFQVNVLPLEERPEDLFTATSFFILHAFDKRRDKDELYDKLFPGKLRAHTAEEKEKVLKQLAIHITEDILPYIGARKWPGNFRNLRITLDYAMIQIEAFSDRSDFIHQYKQIFTNALDKYSARMESYSGQHSVPLCLTTVEDIEDPKMVDLIDQIKIVLPSAKESEIRRIAGFLKKSDHHGFTSADFGRSIGYNTPRTAQSRIKVLVIRGILSKSERLRGRYYFEKPFHATPASSNVNHAQFQLPENTSATFVPSEELASIVQSIENGYGIHLNAEQDVSYGNRYLIALGYLLKEKYQLFYYSFENGGPEELTHQISNCIQFTDIDESPSKESQSLELKIAALSGYLHHYFSGHKPVLLLNHLESLKDSNAKNAVIEIIHFWNAFSIIISGRKMDIRNSRLTEFIL